MLTRRIARRAFDLLDHAARARVQLHRDAHLYTPAQRRELRASMAAVDAAVERAMDAYGNADTHCAAAFEPECARC